MVNNTTLLKSSIEKSGVTFSRSSALTVGLLIYLIFYCTVLQAANITVHSSRNPVAIDDSFHLIYEADGNVDDEPDFSPLSQDFDVLSSSQSTNMRLINGNYSLKKSWDLSVIAKQTGTFTIPSVKFGNDLSPAIQVTVHENTATNNLAPNSQSPNSSSPNNQGTIPAAIFLENSLDKKETWVQAQLIYTIRLLRNVSVIGGSLTEAPETNDPDAIIHKISEDSYQTTRDNIRYDVFERRYAIFPQKSGTLKIHPMTFEGRINARQSRSLFDQFRMSGQLKRLRSKTLEATVNAAPLSINLQDWLPANDIQLVEEWSDDIQQIKTGEPITRTITIIADGLSGLQLPDLDIEEINNIKQYPDKPVVEDRKSTSTKGITGMKQIKIAMIPASAGNYTLPEIKLSWWNTTSNKKETAVIPEKKITVTGSATSTAIPAQPATPSNVPNVSLTEKKLDDFSPQKENNGNLWQWLSLFFAIAWLITLFLFFKKSKPEKAIPSPINKKTKSAKLLASTVIKHAQNNEAKQTKNTLIQWAKIFFEDDKLNNLTQIAQRCQSELSNEITQLNKILYSPEHASWNGSKLLTAFKRQQAHTKQQLKNETTALKPLYQK
jgi:hypothetical protein